MKRRRTGCRNDYFLRLIVGIVLGVGLFISILSFYILMLSIFLLLQKNTTKLESLLLIGYSPNKVALPYQLLTVGLNVIVLVLSIGLVSWLRSYYIDSIRLLFPQLETGSLWAAISMGVVLFIVVSVINILAVKRKVLSIWTINHKGIIRTKVCNIIHILYCFDESFLRS